MDFLQNILYPLFPIFGAAGCLIICAAILIPAAAYTGRKGERYSVLNHFISELGEIGVSRFARVFNVGLMVAGIILLPFLFGLGFIIQNFWAKLGMLAGIWATVSCVLVGVFPMNKLEPHGKAALSFFRGGLVMVILFTIAILAQPDDAIVIPKTVGIPGFIAILAYASFLFLIPKLEGEVDASSFDPANMPDRPRIWLIAAVEWLVFFTTITWFLVVAALIGF